MEEVLNRIHEELHIEDAKNIFKKNNKEKVEKNTNIQVNIPTVDGHIDDRILSPLKYFMASTGKNLRRSLILGINEWMKAPKEIEHLVSEISYLSHNYSLIIDDIQDDSVLRRGRPCVHLVYGIVNALVTTSYVSANGMNLILNMKDPQLTKLVYETSMDILLGQTMDIYWRENSICPTEHEYKEMVLRKTGGLFFLVQLMLQHLTKNKVDVTPVLTALTLYFQINDDYINLWDETYQEGKGFCEDISEGKFSYPVIYVVQNFPEEGKIISGYTFLKNYADILKQHTHDVELLRYCRSLIEKCGGLEYTKKTIQKYRDIVIEERKKLGPNSIFDEHVAGRFFNDELY